MDADILAGIFAGIAVFVVTIAAVLYLLLKDGIFGRLSQQQVPKRVRLELHDFLLEAADELPKKPESAVLEGVKIDLKPLQPDDAGALFAASSGAEWNGQKSFEPQLLWRYSCGLPDQAGFREHCKELCSQEDGLHFCIVSAKQRTLLLPSRHFTIRWSAQLA